MKARGAGVFNLPNKPGGALEKVLGKIYEAQQKPGEDIDAVLSRIAIPIADVKQMFRDKALADAEVVEGEGEGEEVVVESRELTEKELQALKDKMDLYGFDNLSDEERKIIEANREFFFPRMKAKVAQKEKDAQAASHWDCPNHPEQEEFVVYPPIGTDRGGNLVYAEHGVIVGRYGKATNRWEDGTAGVQPHIAEAADEEESAYCAECGSEALWVRAGVPAAGQVTGQDLVPVPFDQAMIELYQAATPSIPNIVEYLKTLPEGEMLNPNDYTIPAEDYERIHAKYEDAIPVGTWTLLMMNKGPKILGQLVTRSQGETHSCIVCGKSVTINPYGYSPPSTVQPIQDTALWRDPEYGDQYAGGYVCAECIPEISWTDEDWGTIEYDWGIQRTAAVAQAEEEEPEEPEEPEKEIVSCLRCENFNEETQKCNLQEKEDIDNIIAFVLQNGCNLFEGKEEYEEAPPEGEKMEEEKVVKQELPYQAELGPGYSVDEPTTSEQLGVCYTVWHGDTLVGSVFPETGVVRYIVDWSNERQESTGLEKDKDVLLRYLVQQYEGEAGKVARLIRNTVTPGLLDPDVLAEEWAQNRILDIMAEKFPRVSPPVARQALALILESWQFLRKPYFLPRGEKSLISGKERVTPAPDPPGFEDRLGGFTVRTGRSGRSTMLRRIGSPGRKAQELEHEEWLHNLWLQFDDWYHSEPEEARLEQFTTMEQAARHFLEEVAVISPPEHVDKTLEEWGVSKMGRKAQEPDPVANALYQEYLAFVRSGAMFFPDEMDSVMHFLTNVKGLDPSKAKEVVYVWYGGDPWADWPKLRGKKAQEYDHPPVFYRLHTLTDDEIEKEIKFARGDIASLEKVIGGQPLGPQDNADLAYLIEPEAARKKLTEYVEKLLEEVKKRGA